MSRVIHNGEIYHQISPSSLYESELENILFDNSDLIFPGFTWVPFKKTVESDHSSAKADFAIIENSYKEWWVVEVEMGDHSLNTHVLPQVETLLSANYGKPVADYLANKAPALNREKVIDMLKGLPPGVIVVVNTPKSDWQNPIEKIGGQLSVFEIFRSDRNAHVFLIDGFIPGREVEFVSLCSFDPFIPNFLHIASPASLGIAENEIQEISYGDYISDWKRIDSGGTVWLAPIGPNPLPHSHKYGLMHHDDGGLEFRRM